MKKHTPNLFTSLNLLSGCCSVYFAFQDDIKVSILLIIVAAFFDLLDGFLARVLKVAVSYTHLTLPTKDGV